jgi:hypothetical protein
VIQRGSKEEPVWRVLPEIEQGAKFRCSNSDHAIAF